MTAINTLNEQAECLRSQLTLNEARRAELTNRLMVIMQEIGYIEGCNTGCLETSQKMEEMTVGGLTK
jgi:hypothetical protein